MPIAKVQFPDGRVGRFEVPEGTSQEDVMSLAQKQFSEQKQEFPTLQEVRQQIEEERGPQTATFTESMGRGMMDLYQGTLQLGVNVGQTLSENPSIASFLRVTPIGPLTTAAQASSEVLAEGGVTAETINQSVSQELALYNKNNPDFSFGRLAGGLATPLIFLPGGAGGALGQRVLSGIALGSAAAATQPVEDAENFFQKKLTQVAIGGTVGATVPLVGKGLGKIFGKEGFLHELIKPFSKKGIQADISKFLRETITENRAKIETALRSGDENKTVGQVLAEATKGTGEDFGGMLVRLERDLAKESDALKSIYALQSQGRRQIIDRIAGTEDDLARAITIRANNAKRLYNQTAFLQNVEPDKALTDLLNNKFGKVALKSANDIADVEGFTPFEKMVRYLHIVKEGLDEQLSRTGDTALGKESRRAANTVKKNLVNWLENKNPAYKEARTQFQTDSVPINRMQVGKEIKDALVSSLDEDKPSIFANALRNAARTIKKAGGFERFKKLEDVFGEDDVKALKNVAKELAIEARRGKMAAASKSVLGEVSREINISLPRILSRPVVITNHALKLLGQDKTPEYKRLLADLAQSPEKFLRAYKLPSTNKRAQAAIDIVKRLEIIGLSQATGKE